MIDQIVSHCHVSQSYLGVLKYVISRLKGKRKAFLALPKEKRNWLIKEVFKQHKENRKLYSYVMKRI